jgi:hypothetical protein
LSVLQGRRRRVGEYEAYVTMTNDYLRSYQGILLQPTTE